MMRKVYLEGEIGEKFGKEFDIVAKSFSDVFRCLNGNFPEFKKYLIECDEKGVGFTCEVGETPLVDEKELLLQYPEGAMVISAVPAGSKSGGMKILAGIVLIAAAVITQQYYLAAKAAAPAATTGFAAYGGQIAMALGTLGVNLSLQGLAQIMAPDPSVDSDQDESYLFQGAGQNIVEGDPVPICYGKLRIPGRPISFRVRNQRQAFISVYEVDTTPMDNVVTSEETVVTPDGGPDFTIPGYVPETYVATPAPALPTPSLNSGSVGRGGTTRGGGQTIKYSPVSGGKINLV